MKADFLRSCLFLYPEWPVYIEVDGIRKPLLSAQFNQKTQEIVLYGEDKTENRDLA